MAKGKDYVAEKWKTYNTLAGGTSGVTRSENEKKQQSKAWDEASEAQKTADKVGAGRGLVNPSMEDVNKHKWKGTME